MKALLIGLAQAGVLLDCSLKSQKENFKSEYNGARMI